MVGFSSSLAFFLSWHFFFFLFCFVLCVFECDFGQIADISGTVENSLKDGTIRVSWKGLVVVLRVRTRARARTRVQNVPRILQTADVVTTKTRMRMRTRTRMKMKIMAQTFLSSTDRDPVRQYPQPKIWISEKVRGSSIFHPCGRYS